MPLPHSVAVYMKVNRDMNPCKMVLLHLTLLVVCRDVLSSANEYVQHFKTDSLQRLHALYNLNELLSAGHSGLPRTIADDELPTQVSTIKNK